MAEIPSEITVDILSRMPIKSLARFRCVSKLWHQYIDDSHLHKIHGERYAEEPTPVIMFQQNFAHYDYPHPLRILSLRNFKEDLTTASEVQKDGLSAFKVLPFYSRIPAVRVKGSCNGWFYLSLDYGKKVASIWVVVHPLRKECYNVPCVMSRRKPRLCGLGFDTSTNTYKMVCVVQNRQKWKLYAMVHVLGTHSWRKISQVPSYPTSDEAVFADGFLYWLVSERDPTKDEGRKIVWFDVRMEEFGCAEPPKRSLFNDQLVDLRGEVGFVYHYLCSSIEVWVLKQKEWVMHCRFDQNSPLLPHEFIRVVGRLNIVGDIVITAGTKLNIVGGLITEGRSESKRLFVYKLERGELVQVKILGQLDKKCNTKVCMLPISLHSIRGIKASNTDSGRRGFKSFFKNCLGR